MALRVVPTLLYGKGHPYALPFTGTGTEASVRKMTREDLAKFHETWFKPNNATLLVVGDTTLEGIKPKLEKLFATWKPGEVPQRMVPPVAEPEKTVVYLIDRPGSGQSVIFGAQMAPPRNATDAVVLQLVNEIFGGKCSSRINAERARTNTGHMARSACYRLRGASVPTSASRQCRRTKQRNPCPNW
jgi:zinc protease